MYTRTTVYKGPFDVTTIRLAAPWQRGKRVKKPKDEDTNKIILSDHLCFKSYCYIPLWKGNAGRRIDHKLDGAYIGGHAEISPVENAHESLNNHTPFFYGPKESIPQCSKTSNQYHPAINQTKTIGAVKVVALSSPTYLKTGPQPACGFLCIVF